MNILVHLGHPAQFHLYKFIIKNLIKNGNKVIIVSNDKDILIDLLQKEKFPFICIRKKKNKKNTISRFFGLIWNDLKIAYLCIKYSIDLITGSTLEVAQVSWFLRKYSVNADDDDAAVVPIYEKLAGPFVQTSLAPIVCNNGSYENRTIKYSGYHKLAYLHPNYFTPDRNIVEKYIPKNKKYFILRFSALSAYHDVGIKGITDNIAMNIINMLLPHGKVYISSERKLSVDLEKYRLQIDIVDMHHILAFASIVICDSQSMAHEAAMLGTPSIRFNDFVGRISVLEELEHVYGLTYGVKTSEADKLYNKIEELLNISNLNEVFNERLQNMLKDKIDVTAFFTWFIENYPESKKIMKENPDYQYRFK
ncbi:MAG TPA: DUF354 domain-containing protein [Bacteroidales bacterium]|nr:DUF354 domain-containing protein [Bacteroidales bacterium]